MNGALPNQKYDIATSLNYNESGEKVTFSQNTNF